jgi:hypothetical protein
MYISALSVNYTTLFKWKILFHEADPRPFSFQQNPFVVSLHILLDTSNYMFRPFWNMIRENQVQATRYIEHLCVIKRTGVLYIFLIVIGSPWWWPTNSETCSRKKYYVIFSDICKLIVSAFCWTYNRLLFSERKTYKLRLLFVAHRLTGTFGYNFWWSVNIAFVDTL